MLLAMLEFGLPHARRFGREIRAWRAASYCWRNHEILISKLPKDLHVLHEVQRHYRNRPANLNTIIVLRDPRDVLTSHHSEFERRYFIGTRDWRKRHDYFLRHRDDPETMVIKYEQVVGNVRSTQEKIEAFVGEKMARPLANFHTDYRPGFDQGALNGWRPVDTKGVRRWAGAEHADRVREMLRDIPDLPEILIDLGYERDDSWIKSY